ncbi:MAG: DUF2330 domain-containing protein [Candidatus Diapherotrites archaeon]|nr:DUF2330 domain-containing protein [Candidatus Diapherotrites archaeon]
MRKAILLLLLLSFFSAGAFANGMVMRPPDYGKDVFIPEQKAVIFWDGATEKMIIESKITLQDIENIAWVLPVESSTKPIVETADEEIFFRLADLFKPPQKSRGGIEIMSAMDTANIEGVEVIEQLKLDIYDITILRATDETALIEWLNQNGYSFPPALPSLLRDYVQNGSYYFIANKINLSNKYGDLNVTNADFECAQRITSDAEQDNSFRVSLYHSGNLEGELGYWASNYSECSGINTKAVSALVSIRLGIATPLKITFTPSHAFYPMRISSFNPGSGTARVYVVGSKPYTDSSGVFSLQNMVVVKDDYLSQYGVKNGDTVSLLLWEGNYYSLTKDSLFVETPFKPELDPKYVPPLQLIGEMLGGLLAVLLFALVVSLVILLIPLIIIPFAIGIAVSWLMGAMKNKKSMFFKNRPLAWIIAALLVIAGPMVFLSVYLVPMLEWRDAFSIFMYLVMALASLVMIFPPYYASMALGFMYRKSGYKKKWLLGPLAVFVVIMLVILFLMFGSTVVY